MKTNINLIQHLLIIEDYDLHDEALTSLLRETEAKADEVLRPLGQENREGIADTENFDYLVSVAFPHKEKVIAQYYDEQKKKCVRGPIEYRLLKQEEQYKFIVYILNRNINMLHDGKYHFWLEKCRSEDLHFHGRITNKMCMKDIKIVFHKIFGISMNHKHFIDIKKYDATKFRSYDTKLTKGYQTYDKPHLKNI